MLKERWVEGRVVLDGRSEKNLLRFGKVALTGV